LILTLKFIMKRDFLLGISRTRGRAVLLLALAGLVVACGDEATVQQVEMTTEEAQPEGERPPPREGPDGCYIPEQRACDCAIVEADCTEDVGVWTMGCASCAAP
jgi:hypothetical protein